MRLHCLSNRLSVRPPCTRRRFCSCLRFCTLTTTLANQTRSIRCQGASPVPKACYATTDATASGVRKLRQASRIPTSATPMAFGVVGDVREDTVLRATARCFGLCGLATCFGASTTTLGSEVVAPPEGVAVCDIAVPLRPHRSSALDKIATAKLATKSDENLIAMSSRMRRQPIPSRNTGYHVPMRVGPLPTSN